MDILSGKTKKDATVGVVQETYTQPYLSLATRTLSRFLKKYSINIPTQTLA
jgi:hypothetical protein